jgi:hypothetical protein
MCRIGVIPRQQVIETMLGIIGKMVREVESKAAQAWCADRDQQSFDGFSTFPQIVETGFDQFCTR